MSWVISHLMAFASSKHIRLADLLGSEDGAEKNRHQHDTPIELTKQTVSYMQRQVSPERAQGLVDLRANCFQSTWGQGATHTAPPRPLHYCFLATESCCLHHNPACTQVLSFAHNIAQHGYDNVQQMSAGLQSAHITSLLCRCVSSWHCLLQDWKLYADIGVTVSAYTVKGFLADLMNNFAAPVPKYSNSRATDLTLLRYKEEQEHHLAGQVC